MSGRRRPGGGLARRAARAVMTAVEPILVRPDWARLVDRRTLRADAIAGVTGASIVLPQGVAFAAIAGLPPEYGFYTAMVTPVVAALTGSSWHTVSGPTTAISALVFGALAGALVPGSPDFTAAAIALALLVGLIQLALGMARMGVLVDFVSHSVMTGFVTGAAVLIGLSQLRHVLALDLPRPEHLTEFGTALLSAAPGTRIDALVIAAVAIGVGVGVRSVSRTWPNYLLALAAGTAVSLALGGVEAGVATIGDVDPAAPGFSAPAVDFVFIETFGTAAVAIALVGLLEALSVSRAIASRSGQPIDGNREVLGQGLSNTIGSFFQCYPGSASFTRSGVNYEAGARTPVSAIFAALFLFLILQFVASWFAYVPTAAMGGVIMLVAWRLIDFAEIRRLATTSGSETVIALATLLATLLIDLEISVYVGVFLSVLFFVRDASRPNLAIGAPNPSAPNRRFGVLGAEDLEECPQVIFARINGPLFFGSVEYVRRFFRQLEAERPDQKHMIFIMKGVDEIDVPGADLLIEEERRRADRNGSLRLHIRTPRVIDKLARFKVMRALTRSRFHLSKGDAIAAVVPQLDPEICRRCRTRIFLECPPRPAPEDASEEPETAT